MRTEFWLEILKEQDHSEDLQVWTAFVWLRIGTGGGLLPPHIMRIPNLKAVSQTQLHNEYFMNSVYNYRYIKSLETVQSIFICHFNVCIYIYK
jgi:hypothetical protein